MLKKDIIDKTYKKVENKQYKSIISQTVKKIRNSFLMLSLGAAALYALSYYEIIDLKNRTQERINTEVKEYVSNSNTIDRVAKQQATKHFNENKNEIANATRQSIDSKVDEIEDEIKEYSKEVIDKRVSELSERWYNEEKDNIKGIEEKNDSNIDIKVPKSNYVSDVITQLNPSIKYIIYVDKKNNTTKLIDASTNNIIYNFKSSDGTGHGPKQYKGDKRTPEGVYTVGLRHYNPSKQDLHGAASLRISYPNSYDLSLNRNGSGLSICGCGTSQREKAVRYGNDASNGSVLLENSDITNLYRKIQNNIDNTLLIIEDPSRPIDLSNYKNEIMKK